MAAIPPSTRSGLMALSRHYARPGAAVHLVQRSLATAATASTTRTAAAPASALLSRQQCRSRPGMLSASPAARRGYADIARPEESTPQQQQQQQQSQSKQQQKKKKAGFFRWMWRLTVLTTIGMGGGLVYGIYSGNTPQEQMVPDPTKKTLVILGSGWGAVSLIKKLDTENYNVIVISPRNFFLFTPLLPSCTTGMIEHRSIMEPIRSILRHKKASVMYYEAEATKIDYDSKVVHMTSNSEVTGDTTTTQVPFDMLVVGVGAENATFGIKGVKEHSCFLKEVGDAQRIRKRIMDCVETAMFKDQSPEEIKRLLHMVVVGGGPTGVEFAGELQDFFNQDLRKWIPEIKDNFRVTLVEALPNVLPMFSKALIDYTESTFKEEEITIRTKTMVKEVTDKFIEAEVTQPDGTKILEHIPYGLLVWATGNAVRPVVRDLMAQIPEQSKSRRGLAVNEYLVVNGTENVWAVGDCAITNYAPTAQVAAQEGSFLGGMFNAMAEADRTESELKALSTAQAEAKDQEERNKVLDRIRVLQRKLRRARQVGPFQYSHQGSLAYIGKERAVADITWLSGNIASGGTLTYLFWRSAYLSMCFSTRNRVLVAADWTKAQIFGRDVSRE